VRELVQNYLQEEPIPGIEYEYELYKRYLPTITVGEVNALISKWIKPVDRAIIVIAPETEKGKLASTQQLTALLNKPFGKLKPYEDKGVKGSILAKIPEAGKVVSQIKVDTLGVTELILSNGARVILKPTNYKNNQIVFSAISRGGSSLYSDADYLSAANASTMAIIGGLGIYDINSLQKLLTGKQVNVSPSISNYSEGISGNATPKDLSTAFELINGYFTQPRRDTNMFQVVQQQLVTSLVNKGKDPSSVFNDSVSYIMSGYHPRRKPLSVDRLNEISLDKSLKIYKERFANASDFIFTFVGNFKVDSITPLVEKYIASIPSTDAKEDFKDIGVRFPTGTLNKVIKKGKEQKSSVRISFTGTTQYSDLEATQLDQLSKVLSIRLREVLREDQGGVYGVNVGANINREPINSYSVTISFTSSTENLNKLTDLVTIEINALKEKGASQTNIDKVIAEDTRSMEVAVKDNSYWLYNLEQKYYFKEDPTTILNDAKMVRQLTIERTKELANRYFKEDNVAKFILAPES
jgi:zinc protease